MRRQSGIRVRMIWSKSGASALKCRFTVSEVSTTQNWRQFLAVFPDDARLICNVVKSVVWEVAETGSFLYVLRHLVIAHIFGK